MSLGFGLSLSLMQNGFGAAVIGVWILAAGAWNDAGSWDDTAVWKDS